MALGDLIQSANNAINGKRAEISVRVRATAEGSFEVDLSLVQSLMEHTKSLLGTDLRNGVSIDQQNGSAPGGWTGHDAIGAYAGVARHVAKSAESNRTRDLAWSSLERTGRPGVRAC
jgi:hypothetical protein